MSKSIKRFDIKLQVAPEPLPDSEWNRLELLISRLITRFHTAAESTDIPQNKNGADAA